MRRIGPAILVLLTAATTLAAEPTTKVAATLPSTLPTTQAADRDGPQFTGPPILCPTVRSAVKLSMAGRNLAMDTDLPKGGMAVRLIKIADWPGKTFGTIDTRNGARMISLQHDVPGPGADDDTIYTLSSIEDDVRLSVDSEDPHFLRGVQYIQQSIHISDEQPVKLFVSIIDKSTNAKTVDIKLYADDFTQLRQQHPVEVTQYLAPLLATLGQEEIAFSINPREAWQVFSPQWPIDPSVRSKVMKLIADFDSDDYATRAAATDALQSAGEPAARVVQTLDRSKFSPEQNSQLDAFIAPFHPLPADVAKARSTSIPFLLDSLYTDDEKIRTSALAALSQAVGHPLTIDPAEAADKWSADLHTLRQQVLLNGKAEPAFPR